MRMTALVLFGALGLAASAMSASAAPIGAVTATPQASNIEEVAGGCGWGFHRFRGYCVRNRHYRPYAYYRPYYYPPYPYYYGGGYEPWNRPSPGDYIANQLNAQELGRGYWGY